MVWDQHKDIEWFKDTLAFNAIEKSGKSTKIDITSTNIWKKSARILNVYYKGRSPDYRLYVQSATAATTKKLRWEESDELT